jgi:hypothetical protein
MLPISWSDPNGGHDITSRHSGRVMNQRQPKKESKRAIKKPLETKGFFDVTEGV